MNINFIEYSVVIGLCKFFLEETVYECNFDQSNIIDNCFTTEILVIPYWLFISEMEPDTPCLMLLPSVR